MTLNELLNTAPADFTDEMIDALAEAHAVLHGRFKGAKDDAERQEIARQHSGVVTKWLSLNKRHAMKNALDKTLTKELTEASAASSDIEDGLAELREYQRMAGMSDTTSAELQARYDQTVQELKDMGVILNYLGPLDGDKSLFYQTRTAPGDVPRSVTRIDQKGKYSLQVTVDGGRLTLVMKFQVGKKHAAYQLFVPDSLRVLVERKPDDEAAPEIIDVRKTIQAVLDTLDEGKTFRGRPEAELGPGAALDLPVWEIQESKDGRLDVAIDAGTYEAIYAFDDVYSARYELSDGALKRKSFVVRGIKVEWDEGERIWYFNCAAASTNIEQRAIEQGSARMPGSEVLEESAIESFKEEDSRRYVVIKVSNLMVKDMHGTRMTRAAAEENVDLISSGKLPMYYAHVYNRPENHIGHWVKGWVGDDGFLRAQGQLVCDDHLWELIQSHSLRGSSPGFKHPVVDYNSDIVSCIFVEISLIGLWSGEDTEIEAAYTATRSAPAGPETENKEGMIMLNKKDKEEAQGAFKKLKAFFFSDEGEPETRGANASEEDAATAKTDEATDTKEAAKTDEATEQEVTQEVKAITEQAVKEIVAQTVKDTIAEALKPLTDEITEMKVAIAMVAKLKAALTSEVETRGLVINTFRDEIKKEVLAPIMTLAKRLEKIEGTETRGGSAESIGVQEAKKPPEPERPVDKLPSVAGIIGNVPS